MGESGQEKPEDGQASLSGHTAQAETSERAPDLPSEGVDASNTSHGRRMPEAVDNKYINPWKHVVVWSVGVVFASLIPIGWAYESSNPSAYTPSIYRLLASGELYLVSIVVLIAGITEIALLLRQIEQSLLVALLVLSAIIIVTIDAARYAGASALPVNILSPPHSTTYVSGALFVFSALHSSTCVRLAAGAR